MTTKKTQPTRTRTPSADEVLTVFQPAHAAGHAIIDHDSLRYRLALTGNTARSPRQVDAWIAKALDRDLIRRGVTGYWVTEAPDPGAIAVMRCALRETACTEEG